MRHYIKIYALPGFLGLPGDWLNLKFPENSKLCPVDYYDSCYSDVIFGMRAWAKSFNDQVDAKDINILMGYSMGGRLALHCLQENCKIWRGAIFLSTHPGLQNLNEKKERLTADNKWAEVIEKDPWESFLRKWNEQSVFAGSNVKRKQENYCQTKLANTLRCWSLAKQVNFRPFLSSVDLPILWLVGEKDEKFKEIVNSITLKNRRSKKVILPNASHRVIADELFELDKYLVSFLKQC